MADTAADIYDLYARTLSRWSTAIGCAPDQLELFLYRQPGGIASKDSRQGIADSVADQLRALGVKGILVRMAEEGEITALECAMPDCRCPRGRGYFVPASQPPADWEPTMDHITLKTEGGHRTAENSRLAHRLCNRIDYSIAIGRSHRRDLARIEAERERMEAEDPAAPTETESL